MKKTLLLSILCALLLGLNSCGDKTEGRCHITGTVEGEQYEGKRIFLVPLEGPQDAAHVDSIEIKDGKFEFTKDTTMLAKILIDYHYRMDLQTLLVVVEPGEVRVTIGHISSAYGTPQNDKLQQWKVQTEEHNMRTGLMGKNARKAYDTGDTVTANHFKQQVDSIHLAYKHYTRQLADELKEGVLHDFLMKLYPKTYKRKMPDGSMVTVDSDTNEPVK